MVYWAAGCWLVFFFSQPSSYLLLQHLHVEVRVWAEQLPAGQWHCGEALQKRLEKSCVRIKKEAEGERMKQKENSVYLFLIIKKTLKKKQCLKKKIPSPNCVLNLGKVLFKEEQNFSKLLCKSFDVTDERVRQWKSPSPHPLPQSPSMERWFCNWHLFNSYSMFI